VSEEYTIRELDLEHDIPKLVDMWAASDDQWPGTWSGGVELTERMIADWMERDKSLNTYVVDTGTQIVGYCSFHERGEEKDVGYVGVLNVQPDHQKKSLARRMLTRCVERAVELGYKQVTLHTWPGNLKSVPLYKKTGLYWVPDTGVHMRNFIPSILAMPCAAPYFHAHDWYGTFQRVLEQKEDDERWQGMKVFTYRWAADGDALTVWIDREAHTPTAVETNRFCAAAIAGNIEPAKGLPTRMRWMLKNKGDQPMQVSLIANGTEHIVLEHRAALAVAPGETAELEAQVEVLVDAPDVLHGKPVPAVRTLLIIDGEVVELATGMRPRAAVTIETEPRHVTVFPDVCKTVHLQLRNYQEDAIEAAISLAPPPGLEVDWTERTITVPGKSYAGAPVALRAARGGVYDLQATAYFPGGKTAPQRLAIFSLGTGEVLGDVGEKQIRLENEWTRLTVDLHGGWLAAHAPVGNASLGGMRETAGPPFWPSELDDKKFTCDLVREDGRVTAVMSAALDEHPGLVLRREVILGAGPLAEVRNTWLNHGTEPRSIQIQLWTHASQRDGATITLPLAGGTVQSRMSEFPAAEEDVNKQPEALAERWLAVTSQYGTYGLIWDDTVVENEIGGWGLAFLRAKQTCAPQEWTPAGTFTLYAGPGDWRNVRNHARRLAGTDGAEEPIPVEVRPVCDARLEPSPLVTVGDRIAAMLTIDNLRARPVTGQAQLTTADGLTVDRGAFAFEDVTVEKPFEQPVEVSLAPEAAAYEGTLSVRTQLADVEVALSAIRLGTNDPVTVVEHGDTWTIDNGRTCNTVAPGFSGALSAWVEDGVDHLISPYPEVKTFGWMSPWYGGLMPLAMHGRNDMPGKLGDETFTAVAIQATDARGLPWTGVRASCQMVREPLVGLALELEYLTVGKSNVLKLVYRVRNDTTARRDLGCGWLSFWQLDGTAEHNTLHSAEIQRKPTVWEGWSEAGKWGLVTNAETGRTAVLVSPYPIVRLIDWGDVGGHLGLIGRMSIPASGVAERVGYLALCASMDAAKRYAALKDYL
jgi:RimJ/RimL family protein N-acetyltransferase